MRIMAYDRASVIEISPSTTTIVTPRRLLRERRRMELPIG
jgi:hypothetical protein